MAKKKKKPKPKTKQKPPQTNKKPQTEQNKMKPKQPNLKMGKRYSYKGVFTKENIKVVSMYMKSCSMLLAIREMEIKIMRPLHN